MPYFFMFLCYILTFGLSGLNCKFIRREDGFSINLKISFMSLGDQPMLALKISVTHFADLDILPILILKFYI